MGFLQINHARTASIKTTTTTTTMLLLFLLAAAMVVHAQPQPAQLGQCLANCSQRTIGCTMQYGGAPVLDSVPCLTNCGTTSIACVTGCLGGVNPPPPTGV